MFDPPYELISCAWPCPPQEVDKQWIFQPKWDEPRMPIQPEPYWEEIQGELYWTMNWSYLFRHGWHPLGGNPMLGFSIVFCIKIQASGILVISDNQRSIMRINGKNIQGSCNTHVISQCEIKVNEGDKLEIAQGHFNKNWQWSARLIQNGQYDAVTPTDMLLSYLAPVQQQLLHPNGPPLKIYTNGHTPVRAVATIYSLILNGCYAPSAIYLFGENQWSERARHLFSTALPFAQVISHEQVLSRLHSLGVPELVDLAQQHWFVMKTCICLLYPPEEFCSLDDDVFILDSLDDALAAFRSHDLVYTHDLEYGKYYLSTWKNLQGLPSELSTGRLNAGLFWLRNHYDSHWLAQRMLVGELNLSYCCFWEQGFLAVTYADHPTFELPQQRYIHVLFDGLPGGPLGYDYEHNPCGFASIHFAGSPEKPSDGITITILKKLLHHHDCKFAN